MTTLHPCRPVGLDYLESAPTVFTNSVDIALTPDQLFEVLARADTWSRWASVITDVEYTSPEPYGVGTTRVVTMRGGIVGDEEFLAWEPGRRLACGEFPLERGEGRLAHRPRPGGDSHLLDRFDECHSAGTIIHLIPAECIA